MFATLEEAKNYLRIDNESEDDLINTMITTGIQLCVEVTRTDMETLANYPELCKTAVLYTVAYLYEHREERDHHELITMLKYLLFPIRREVF